MKILLLITLLAWYMFKTALALWKHGEPQTTTSNFFITALSHIIKVAFLYHLGIFDILTK